MKNLSVIIILCVVLFAVLGCGMVERIQNGVEEKPSSANSNSANKAISDQATENVLREQTGIAECDEVLNILADQSKSQDENILTKAAKEMAFNRIRQSLKDSIQQNQNDKERLAQTCREFKTQLDKYQSEQNSNK